MNERLDNTTLGEGRGGMGQIYYCDGAEITDSWSLCYRENWRRMQNARVQLEFTFYGDPFGL